MPFDPRQRTSGCTVCGSPANILQTTFRVGEVVNCSRCGDFRVSHVVADDFGLPFREPKKQALASYTIRKMQPPGAPRPELTAEFFRALERRSLPTPGEVIDNLLLWLADKADNLPGARLELTYSQDLFGAIGIVGQNDAAWIIRTLTSQEMIELARGITGQFNWTGHLTAQGWTRVEELRQAHIASKFAFFARQFNNPDLDRLFNECLQRAVAETSFELRPATQRAGLIDAVIEDEIRRCRFVVADLSNKNDGAYWEAGFAEGLGKDVIYICRDTDEQGIEINTHFDANHRQTVKWNLADLDDFARRLKAVIRNSLLGDAKQSD